MRSNRHLSTLLLLAAGCAVEPVAPSAEPIIQGEPEPGYRGVVGVLDTSGPIPNGRCSGTVIGPFAVLTAKHCVFTEAGALVPPWSLSVAVGQDISGTGLVETLVGVVEIRTTPGPGSSSTTTGRDDIAILLLARDIGEDPFELGLAPPSPGDPLTIVGYGRRMPGVPAWTDFGERSSGDTVVTDVFAGVFLTTGASWICHGDSGGPAFDAASRVVGVASFGTDLTCMNAVGGFAEVSQHATLIADALAFVPVCDPTTEVCNGADDDCNGIVDDGCRRTGTPCVLREECASGMCETVGDARVCTERCDPTRRSACRLSSLRCAATGCGEGRCVASGGGTVEPGGECATDSECATGLCRRIDGTLRCGEVCAPGADPCPADLLCVIPAGDCGACLPEALATHPRLFGAPCDDDAACASGLCREGICTQPCDATTAPCPAGTHCRDALCAPGPLGDAGDECRTDEDCGVAAPECAADGESYCAAACNALGRCGTGFACVDTDRGARCLPEGIGLGAACTGSADCRSGMCASTCTRACVSDRECPPGFSCGPGGTCLAPAPVDDGGCSCRAAVSSRAPELGWMALAFPLRARRRRRRPGSGPQPLAAPTVG